MQMIGFLGFKKFNWNSLWVLLDAGPGAVNFIIDHAEIDFVFIQDKKVSEVILKIFDLLFG